MIVLQQGCFPAPMLQSPAIFLQHSISACVMCGLGRQASAGVESQIARRAKTTMDRRRIRTTCYLSRKQFRNWHLRELFGRTPNVGYQGRLGSFKMRMMVAIVFQLRVVAGAP